MFSSYHLLLRHDKDSLVARAERLESSYFRGEMIEEDYEAEWRACMILAETLHGAQAGREVVREAEEKVHGNIAI
mgnify:CR=1 FL=1